MVCRAALYFDCHPLRWTWKPSVAISFTQQYILCLHCHRSGVFKLSGVGIRRNTPGETKWTAVWSNIFVKNDDQSDANILSMPHWRLGVLFIYDEVLLVGIRSVQTPPWDVPLDSGLYRSLSFKYSRLAKRMFAANRWVHIHFVDIHFWIRTFFNLQIVFKLSHCWDIFTTIIINNTIKYIY